mgnify:CR=1 FL=1
MNTPRSRREFVRDGALGITAMTLLSNETAHADGTETLLSGQPTPLHFEKKTLNANSDIEVACAMDINGDGNLEVVSGDMWYESGTYAPHKFREIGDWGKGPDSSGYRHDFADLPMDVTGDGKMDLVCAEWATAEVSWWENPGESGKMWERHLIAKPGNSETAIFAPLLGEKARPCILPNVAQKVVFYELRTQGKKPEWIEHVVGTEGAGHGCGWGDLNGNGKADIITPRGWYENIDAANDKWIWHADWNCNPGDCSIGMLVHDWDGDGKNEVVFGSGHNYGLYWIKPNTGGTDPKYIQWLIDKSWSQAHSLILAPLEKKNELVILTGKRFKAHDHDPGAEDPLILCYYKWDRKAKMWSKFVIDYGERAGAGLQLNAVDLRGTGRLDIIAPGKTGLYVFENHGMRR